MDDFDYDDPYYNNYNKNNHVYNHPIVLQTQRRPEHYAILSSPSVTTPIQWYHYQHQHEHFGV